MGTENSGLYTVPAGADEDHLYLLQQPFNDSDIDGRCTYLQYDLKEQTMEPLYESRVKIHRSLQTILYISSRTTNTGS